MRLTKHHGLGNDFLVAADPSLTPDADLARAACERHRGIGADGLLFLGPGDGDTDARMVLLNADGSRAEMSGNGIGCLVQAAVLTGVVTGPAVRIHTDAGVRDVDIRTGSAPRSHVVTVGMGEPVAGEDEYEWTGGEILRAMRVDVGNPHLVLQAADPQQLADRDWIAELGRKANAAIAGGINVEIITLGEASDEVRMDVWERGVGLTAACGTGAVASAVAARRWELVGDDVVVRMTGGPVIVGLQDPEARLTTSITFVGTMDYPWP